jgi:alpha-methylacyl-CoA racemase
MCPLKGMQVIELAGLGPAPMACTMFADMGAEVIRIERSTTRLADQQKDVSYRGKKSVAAAHRSSRLRVRAFASAVEHVASDKSSGLYYAVQ